jgi:energy-coupling factor transporter ATP-binding protein EcfA2
MTAARPAAFGAGTAPNLPGLRTSSRELAERLSNGEHLILWGPAGSGKTTLVAAIQRRLPDRACATSRVTESLDDITRTLERAYPNVPTACVSRRTARARLWRAADQEAAVLLLDHVGIVGTAMKGFLRRLRGGIAGVLLVFDIDSPRARVLLRAQHLGCLSLRMAVLPGRIRSRLLASLWPPGEHSYPGRAIVSRLIRAARGRPGWIVVCADLAADPQYWRADAMMVQSLALDTELRLRAVTVSPSIPETARILDRPIRTLPC